MLTRYDKTYAAILGGFIGATIGHFGDLDPETTAAICTVVSSFLVNRIPNKPAAE